MANLNEQMRETVDDALEIVSTWGPYGRDINDGMRCAIVLAEEVQRLRRQHGSAAQAVAQPFGYIVCEKTDAGTDEFIYRQAWDNISPEGRTQYVIKTELFTAPPVAAEQPAAAGNALTEALERVAAYIERRKKSRGLDIEHVQGFDLGPNEGVELLLSDIETIAAHTRAAGQDGKDGERIARAYGYLWHVNAGKDAPAEAAPLSLSPETAAYAARRILRDMLTHEQRGKGIDAARAAMQAKSAQGGGE